MFLNDLSDSFAKSNDIIGITVQNDQNADEIPDFFKIFILIYADDTVILSESVEDFQESLHLYEDYCKTWKLIFIHLNLKL
jgi:hypothetical protein